MLTRFQSFLQCSSVENNVCIYLLILTERHFHACGCTGMFFQILLPCLECRRDLATRILSVRLSICLFLRQTPSVQRVHCEKNGGKICPDFYTARKIIPPIVF